MLRPIKSSEPAWQAREKFKGAKKKIKKRGARGKETRECESITRSRGEKKLDRVSLATEIKHKIHSRVQLLWVNTRWPNTNPFA